MLFRSEGMLINQKWPSRLKYDAVSAENFETLMVIVSEVRRLSQELSGVSQGKKWTLLYDHDALVDDNQLLIAALAKVAAVIDCEGQPRGIRLALHNREIYLDVPADVVTQYCEKLEQRILAVGREMDILHARMTNPRYVSNAPAALVQQTREAYEEKTALLERLKNELVVIS